VGYDIFRLLSSIITLYQYVIIAGAILSWLIAFNVVNPRNQFVAGIGRFTYSLTEPALRQIRRFLPSLGGVDLSPIALLLGLEVVRIVLKQLLVRGF
jgi:YggT family protein